MATHFGRVLETQILTEPLVVAELAKIGSEASKDLPLRTEFDVDPLDMIYIMVVVSAISAIGAMRGLELSSDIDREAEDILSDIAEGSLEWQERKVLLVIAHGCLISRNLRPIWTSVFRPAETISFAEDYDQEELVRHLHPIQLTARYMLEKMDGLLLTSA